MLKLVFKYDDWTFEISKSTDGASAIPERSISSSGDYSLQPNDSKLMPAINIRINRVAISLKVHSSTFIWDGLHCIMTASGWISMRIRIVKAEHLGISFGRFDCIRPNWMPPRYVYTIHRSPWTTLRNLANNLKNSIRRYSPPLPTKCLLKALRALSAAHTQQCKHQERLKRFTIQPN